MKMNTDLGFLTAEDFLARRSPTLIKDPQAKLQQNYEVGNYLSGLSDEYFAEITSLATVGSQPLSVDTRVVITVIASSEGSRIRQTLDNYVNQDLPNNRFEIILLDNHPSTKDRDNTHAEVASFKEDNPSISLVYAHKVWANGELATVGNARKYVFDIALTRIHKLGGNDCDTILVSNDADTVSLDTNYLSAILREFDTNSTTDALVTSSVVPFDTIVKPNIYGALSLWDALDDIVAVGEPYNLIGRSSAYRAATYAAVGGYNPKGKMAGDLETGYLIADARKWNPASVVQITTTKQVQDPRRILEAVATRTPVNEMYYRFVSNPEIRDADNKELLDLIPNSLDWELLQEDLDSFWGGRVTGMYKWRGERFASDYQQAMHRIGVEYEVADNRVKITDIRQFLLNYERDFDEQIDIIHSEPRKWDQGRMSEMKSFFSSVTDSAISCRDKMARSIAERIKTAELEDKTYEVEVLLKDYKRFSGKDYPLH